MKYSFITMIGCTLLAAFTSCSSCGLEGSRIENRGLIIRNFSLPECAIPTMPLPDELVIASDSAVQYYFPGSESCALGVDFEFETLLRYTSKGTCNVRFIREVRANNRGGFTYQKNIEECGNCQLGSFDEGWVVAEIQGSDDLLTFTTIRN